MSKIRHKQKLILPFFGFVLLMCLMGWLNVFGQLMKLSINLPSPSLMTTLGFDQSVPASPLGCICVLHLLCRDAGFLALLLTCLLACL